MSIPASAKIQLIDELESIATANIEIIAHIRNVTICPLSVWPRPFGCNHATLPAISQRIRNKKRILVQLLDFIVSQVVCVALLNNKVNHIRVNVLGEQHRIFVIFQPFCYSIFFGIRNFAIYLLRYFHSIEPTHMHQPIPELRNSADRIIITVRIYEHIRVKKIQQTYLSYPSSTRLCT